MNYYKEIESIIKRQEVNKRARIYEENYDTLTNYWNIGKLLIEAQGGEKRAKYGNELIKKWSIEFSSKYGKGYDYTNLQRFKNFYIEFPIVGPLAQQLTWTNIRMILPIKEENKRNYYINLCIERNLSKRELEKEIKSNSYERLINKPSKIEIISNSKLRIEDNIKNPIIIELLPNEKIETEKDLEIKLLSMLKSFFNQLGSGYALIDNQVKIVVGNKNYYIDILLFNVKYNCYCVVELKLRSLKKEDKAQIEFYMNYVDEFIKEAFHNKTMGIIITKEQDKLIANFIKGTNIIPITYELKS